MGTMVYAGTERGIVSLLAEEGSLTEVGRGLESWAVDAVAVDPQDPNRVYAGTRGDGVWASPDAGKSWTKPSYGKPGPGKIRSLAFDPSLPQRLYTGCEPIDLYVTEDQGRNWEKFPSLWSHPHIPTVTYPAAPRVEPHVRHVAVDPTDPNTLYLALQVGYIVKSTDGGKTWNLLDKDLDCDVHTIVIDPRNPQRLTIATGGGDSRKGVTSGRSIYASADGGSTWSGVAMEFWQEYSVPLAMNPSNPDVLFCAVANSNPSRWNRPEGANSSFIRSLDGGAHWENVPLPDPEASKDYIEGIAFDPTRPERMFAGTKEGALFHSADQGSSWEMAPARLTEVTSLAAAPA